MSTLTSHLLIMGICLQSLICLYAIAKWRKADEALRQR